MSNYTDASTAYANNFGYYIKFQHIPTGLRSTFKAFLTSFEDSFESTWNDVDVYGRMDPISTFQGTKRQIDFSFDVVSGDIEEAKSNFEQSRRLIRSLYPVYEDVVSGVYSATSMQAPPLVRIKFINLISSAPGQGINSALVGRLSGITFAPDLDAGFFEKPGSVLPKVNRFNCSFLVFHTEDLGFDEIGNARGEYGRRFPYPDTRTGEEAGRRTAPTPPASDQTVTNENGDGREAFTEEEEQEAIQQEEVERSVAQAVEDNIFLLGGERSYLTPEEEEDLLSLGRR